MKRQQPTRGFTLIELLVVIAIIALLVAMLVPSLKKAKKLAETAVCMANLRAIGSAMMTYNADTGDHMPSAVQGVGNYHTRYNSRFDYKFGGEYATGGLVDQGAFPYDVFACTEESGGSGRVVTDTNSYGPGLMPKNFGDTLCDGEYSAEDTFYCPANKPSGRGFRITTVYDTSTSPWTLDEAACLYSSKPDIFAYGYLISLTHYAWDWSCHGELPGQKGGSPFVRNGVCEPWRLALIRYPAEGAFVVENGAPNNAKIDVNYWGGSTKHDDNGGVNVLYYDGHVALRLASQKPEMFFNWTDLYRSGGHVNDFHYCRHDPDALWRPWFKRFPITDVRDASNQ